MAGGGGAARFLKGGDSDSDSDSDDERRVIKSAKDKRYEELRATTEEIRNKMKINDFLTLLTLFEKLNKQLERTVKLSMTASSAPPRMYVRILVQLEDYVEEAFADKELRKKLSSTNAKAFNSMRQKIKKHNREPDNEEAVKRFRENPVWETDEDEDESDDEDEQMTEDAAMGEEETKGKDDKKKRLFDVPPEEITYEMVEAKLREVILSRGRKGTDRVELVDQLKYIAAVATTPAQTVECLMHVISARFDVTPSMSSHMPVAMWKLCVIDLITCVSV